MPSGLVVRNQMFLQPRIAAAGTVGKHFSTQAAKCPDLGDVVRELANGVVDLHL